MFTAGLMFLLLIALLLIGLPVAIVLGVVSVVWLIVAEQPLRMVASTMYNSMNLFVLMAIPFFIMAGEIMNKTGVTDHLIKFTNTIVGRFRGGLAQASIVTSILFAGITGAGVADVTALGSVFIPAMEKQGYRRSFASTLIAAASIVGPTIPPSIIIVIYAAVAQVSVGGMFAAAIIPGILIGLSHSIYVGLNAKRLNLPRSEVKTTSRDFFISLKNSFLALITPFIIIGGILGGIFTPTEAAAVAVLYALILGLVVFRSINMKDIYHVSLESLRISAMLFFIIGIAGALGWLLAKIGLPGLLAGFFLSITDNVNLIFFIVMVFMIFVGTWLDNGPACIILAPIIAPMMVSLGVHPLHIGVLMVITLNMALITPPLGICLFAACAVGKVKFEEIALQIWPFILVDVIVIILLIFVPQISLFLPQLLGFVK